ncbi:unnamed protein product [Urochloa humidicola]
MATFRFAWTMGFFAGVIQIYLLLSVSVAALTVHSCMAGVIYGLFLLIYPSSSTIYQRKQQSIQLCEAIS